jgi:hypothetical protein
MNICEAQVYAVVPGTTGCVACIDSQYGRADPTHADFVADFRSSEFRMPLPFGAFGG